MKKIMNTINSRRFAEKIKANWVEIYNGDTIRIFDTIASALIEVSVVVYLDADTPTINVEIGHSKENSRDDYVNSIDKIMEKITEYPADYELDDYPINIEEIRSEIEILLYTLLDEIDKILKEYYVNKKTINI